jgi:hypothetical protein
MKRSIYLIFSFILISISSCEIENSTSTTKDAILLWQGEYNQNGCGFVFIIDKVEYKPRNEVFIDNRFKIAGQINVTVEYILLNEIIQFKCGGNPNLEERESLDVLSVREK